MLEPFDFHSPFTQDSGNLTTWAQRWIYQLVSRINAVYKVPGPYANDGAAKAAGVAVNSPYFLPSGAVVVRIT